MSVKRNLRYLDFCGKKYSFWAYENDGQCDFEDFLATLRIESIEKLKKLIALIYWVSNNGPPNDNLAQCYLINNTESGNLYVFVIGGIRVFWFVNNKEMVICSCVEIKQGSNLDSEIEVAFSIKNKIEVIRYGTFKGNYK
jgi:hypothetical protein